MPERNFIIGQLTKTMFIIFIMTFFFVTVSFGRAATKLYSIGNNSAWNSSASWSLSVNGIAAGIVPQSSDTVIIDRIIIQNINFTFSDYGFLDVQYTGLLRGENLNLNFSGHSSLKCEGEIRTGNLSFVENAFFTIESGGKISVSNSLSNNSLSEQLVSGKLNISGNFSNNSISGIAGKGSIEAATYGGNGSVFGFSSMSSVPDGSMITEYNWNGALNNNWDEPLNWVGGILPSESSNISVLPSSNNPDISGKLICGNLFINSQAGLIIYPSAVVEVTGNLSVIGTGKLLLKNTLTEKSSLILDGEVTGKVQVEYPVSKEKKNLVSSPVEMALTGTFLNMYLRSYDESSSQWGEYIVPTDDLLQVMQGYELYSLSSETKIFEGTPNHISKSFAISNSGNGLNLTGNPFPSYIDWENNTNDSWQRNSVAAAIYYPDPSGSGNYSVYMPGGDDAVSLNNGSRYIAPMQGFFVKAAQPGMLTVTGNSRVSNIIDSRTIVKNDAIKFKLNNSDGLSDEAMFRVMANSTFGFDDEFDALKLQGNSESPSLHFESDDNVNYAISTIPTVNSSLSIPLDINCTKEGTFSLTSTGSFNFEYRCPVILQDLELNKFIDLRADSVYSFYHTPDMNSKRFKILFSSTEGIDQHGDILSQVNVYPGEVKVTGTDYDVYTVNLYTADGKLINSARGVLSEGITLETGNISNGVCLLQIFNGKQSVTKKIITQ